MVWPLPAGETVVLHTTGPTTHDEYGNDVLTTVETKVAGVAVWPRTSGTTDTEDGANRLVISGLVALFPPGIAVKATDRVWARGAMYEVEGEPGQWRSYLTGTEAGTQVALRRVEG